MKRRILSLSLGLGIVLSSCNVHAGDTFSVYNQPHKIIHNAGSIRKNITRVEVWTNPNTKIFEFDLRPPFLCPHSGKSNVSIKSFVQGISEEDVIIECVKMVSAFKRVRKMEIAKAFNKKAKEMLNSQCSTPRYPSYSQTQISPPPSIVPQHNDDRNQVHTHLTSHNRTGTGKKDHLFDSGDSLD